MNEYLEMISERKLSISFSKYLAHIVDPTTGMCYIEYFTKPPANADSAFVHESVKHALDVALHNCKCNVVDTSGIVRTEPKGVSL